MHNDLSRLQQSVASIMRDAAELVLSHYRQQDFTVKEKADDSPVTSADIESSQLLSRALEQLTPDLPVLSEEEIVPWEQRRQWQRYWLIDPIDGTQEFINGSGDFAISVSLVDNFTPILGSIYWPTEGLLYQAIKGQPAERLRYAAEGASQPAEAKVIQVRRLADPSRDELIIAVSRRQSQHKVLSRITPQRTVRTLPTGSCSLKSCLVAEGSADCFLRIGPTGEWDTGAAQVIIEQAGGQLISEHFKAVTYNRTASLDNPNFMVLGDPRVDWKKVFSGAVYSE